MAFLKEDSAFTCNSYRFWYWSIRVSFITTQNYYRYGIAPRLVEPGQKPRIEVFNPCDDSDD